MLTTLDTFWIVSYWTADWNSLYQKKIWMKDLIIDSIEFGDFDQLVCQHLNSGTNDEIILLV